MIKRPRSNLGLLYPRAGYNSLRRLNQLSATTCARRHFAVPVARIGFLARDDRAPAKLGAGLLVDAARRVLRSDIMAAWGFILEPEGGPGEGVSVGLV